FTAQSIGSGETHEIPAILVRGFIVAAIIGGGLIALQIPLAAVLFGAMGGSEAVTRAAKTYFVIRIWAAPLALANYVVLGWLIGQARATLALSVQIAINVINMVATVLLVLVADLGIAGAGGGLSHQRPSGAAADPRSPAIVARGAVRPRPADADAYGEPRYHDPY